MSDEHEDPADDVMCQCSGTKRGYIQSLYEQGMDVQAISRWTGALSGCGGCEWDIADFLKELDSKKSHPTNPLEFEIESKQKISLIFPKKT